MFNPHQIKKNFPILDQEAHPGKPLVYLDSAATSQKPKQVAEAMSRYYLTDNANVHRGVHVLSDRATTIWETSKEKVAKFVGAEKDELIFTRNTTEGTNGIAYGWGDHNLKKGDVIVSTLMEHHANLVVWQELCKRTGAKLEVVGLKDEAELDLVEFERAVKQKGVKLVAFVHVSNTLGTVNPVKELVGLVRKHAKGARIVLDAAQSVPHMPVNFHDLDVDFLVFSGHKMLGPMGIGGLVVKKELLESDEMRPWLFGGGMISEVHEQSAIYEDDLSERFTAGTPDVSSALGLATACDFLSKLGMENVMKHDFELVSYAFKQLSGIKGLKIVGPRPENNNRLGSVAFIHESVHAHDLAQILDSEGVAVRSGHHCTMPLHRACGWQATTRASFNVYSTKEDIDALVKAFDKVVKIFKL
ncbi:MAG TPA: SufS family cysteine desulfurase [Patescibacteria group bacterium]|jgi:cysteine desulfurase/selenocysteine lyase